MELQLVFLVILAVFMGSGYVEAQRKWTEFQCKDGFFMPSDEILSQLPPCSDPTVYGTGPDKLHPNCGFYCQVKVFDLLGENGHTSFDIYSSWVDTSFPAQYRDAVRAHFQDCFDKYGNDIDHEDPECKIADAFTQCTWEAVPKMPC